MEFWSQWRKKSGNNEAPFSMDFFGQSGTKIGATPFEGFLLSRAKKIGFSDESEQALITDFRCSQKRQKSLNYSPTPKRKKSCDEQKKSDFQDFGVHKDNNKTPSSVVLENLGSP